MPQVHIVAYCGDLGYGAARGAAMLSLMLAFGIVSRLVSGWISDRIGGLRTLLLGSALQGIALVLFLPFVRDLFSPREAGWRVSTVLTATLFGMAVSTVLTATLFGMAVGGWMSGAIFDLTGSYRAAFVNGIAWNVLNVSIAVWLLRRPGLRPRLAT